LTQVSANRASLLRGYRAVSDGDDTELYADPCPVLRSRRGHFLRAEYDLARATLSIDRDELRRDRSIWRWGFLLPVTDPRHVVSMHEGDTPMVAVPGIGSALGIERLYVKDEGRNPTGSFKDRGASVTASKCVETGVAAMVVASSGNLACSLAAYCARAGIDFYGLIRADTTDVNRLHCQISGQHFFIVKGDMAEGVRLAGDIAERHGWFHAVQPYNLYRIEGKKTLAFEIVEDLDWQVPDRVLVPTSGCTSAIALHKGFEELLAMGWIDRIPSIDVVQPAGCDPVVAAWRSRTPVAPSTGPGTSVVGLGHPHPAGGDLAVAAMMATGGVGLSVSDVAIYRAHAFLARHDGLFLQPAAAAPIAALCDPANDEYLRGLRDQVVVCIGTATGKNQIAEPLARMAPLPVIRADIDAFEAVRPHPGRTASS
jgi:threonine synthase